ncbi:hypothetical protein D9M68_961020 [compost metagenome]
MGRLPTGLVEKVAYLAADEVNRRAGDLRLAGGEVVVQRTFRGLGAGDDVVQAGAGIAPAGQQRGGGTDDTLGGVGFLRQA